jgi:hypothetical protein
MRVGLSTGVGLVFWGCGCWMVAPRQAVGQRAVGVVVGVGRVWLVLGGPGWFRSAGFRSGVPVGGSSACRPVGCCSSLRRARRAWVAWSVSATAGRAVQLEREPPSRSSHNRTSSQPTQRSACQVSTKTGEPQTAPPSLSVRMRCAQRGHRCMSDDLESIAPGGRRSRSARQQRRPRRLRPTRERDCYRRGTAQRYLRELPWDEVSRPINRLTLAHS